MEINKNEYGVKVITLPKQSNVIVIFTNKKSEQKLHVI